MTLVDIIQEVPIVPVTADTIKEQVNVEDLTTTDKTKVTISSENQVEALTVEDIIKVEKE